MATQRIGIAEEATAQEILAKAQEIMTKVQEISRASDPAKMNELLRLTRWIYRASLSFSSCPDALMSTLVSMSLNGEIDLYEDCGWRVGDTRRVRLRSIPQGSVSENQVAQEVTIVLTHHGQRNGLSYSTAAKTTSGSDRYYPAFEWDMVDCLANGGHMSSSNTNSGSWQGSKRRAWIPSFVDAAPGYLVMREFRVKTAAEYNSTSITETPDKASLRAEKEVFGSRVRSNSTEANVLSQVDYYTTAGNRIKGIDAGIAGWWLRSPCSNDNNSFIYVSYKGEVIYASASSSNYLSLFGCIG